MGKLTLAIRTDKPKAELYLFDGQEQVGELKWQAHRELSDTIHQKILDIISNSTSESTPSKANLTNQVSDGGSKELLESLDGIVVFRGPGSFTGLRIGITVANTLADALQTPIAGSFGDDWLAKGLQKLEVGQSDKIVLPKYGAEPNVTLPRK